jgi:hypothetical protein
VHSVNYMWTLSMLNTLASGGGGGELLCRHLGAVGAASWYPHLYACDGPHPLHTFMHGHLFSKLYRQLYLHCPWWCRRLSLSMTVNTLTSLGINLSNSKTVAPTSGATCLGIYFDIQMGILQIPHTKLQEVLSLCKFYILNQKLLKNNCRHFLAL